jgi:hypothetical protein
MSKGILVQDIDAWMAAIAIACVPFSGMFGYTNPEGDWRGLNLLQVIFD